MKTIFFLATLVSFTSAWAMDSEAFNSLVDKSIKTHQKTENTGVAISVFTSNRILLQKGFGLKDREANLPVNAKTLFAIGSTTKAFTALDLKLLENDHQLNFSDKVKDLLPGFKLSSEMITNEATVEDLLSHRIGLPRHDLLWYLSPFNRHELLSRLQYLDFPAKADENFRKTFQYNNLLFMTAGLIVEEKAQTSWESFTQKNIFDVLHMDATQFGVPKDLNVVDVATPYAEETRLNHKDISSVGPAGSVYSNVEDMTKWIQSFMQHRWPNQEDFFKTRIGLDNEHPSLDYAYGLAWMRNSLSKTFTWNFHGGNIDGFSALVLFSPELDLGVVILTNQDNSMLPNDIISDVLSNVIRERTNGIQNKSFNRYNFELFNTEKSFLLSEQTSVDAVSSVTFNHPGYGAISLLQKNGEQWLDYYGHTWKLSSYDKDGFNYVGEGEFNIPFKVESDFIESPFEPQVSNIHFIKAE